MINLLNPEDRRQLRAARFNVRLRRYLIATIAAVCAVGGVYGAGLKIASDDFRTATDKNTQSLEQLAQYNDVKKEANTYRSNLDVAKKILGNEIVFSNFITNTASILPPNTVLANISLTTKLSSAAATKNTTQLRARTKSYADILALKTSLEQSKLFSDVRIESMTAPGTTKDAPGTGSAYPFQVIFSVTINTLGGSVK